MLRSAVRGPQAGEGGQRLAVVKKKIVEPNTVRESRPPMSPALRAELVKPSDGRWRCCPGSWTGT